MVAAEEDPAPGKAAQNCPTSFKRSVCEEIQEIPNDKSSSSSEGLGAQNGRKR